MIPRAAALLALALAAPPARGAGNPEDGATLIRQDVTIKSKSAVGPEVRAPAPAPAAAVLREVIESLEITRRSHPGEYQMVAVDATARRLAMPFPKPPYLVFSLKRPMEFEHWRFDIVDGDEVVWHAAGEGELSWKLEWDGTGYTGSMAAKVGRSYRWRFTAAAGGERFAAMSEPVSMRSMAYREALGTEHLEAANDLVFEPGKAKLSRSSKDFLVPMAERLRRVEVGDQPYRLTLFHGNSGSDLARRRAAALRSTFAKYLLIAPARVEVDIRPSSERGDVTDCPIP